MMSSFYNILNLIPKFNNHIPIFVPYKANSLNVFKKIRLGCLATHKHPKSYKFFRSVASINKERKRQFQYSKPWIIHPFSIIRFYWEIIMTFTYMISFITIPFMISFIIFDYERIRFDEVNPFLYIFFWLDICFNFITGVYYKSKKRISLLQKEIFMNYLKSFLIIDILTSLPYDHMFHQWRNIPGPKSSVFIAILNFLPVLKITRFMTFYCYISQIFEYFQIKDLVYRVTKILILSFYLIYWMTCLFYLTTVLIMYLNQVSVDECDCWLEDTVNRTISIRFKKAFFIILQNFMTSGFDEVEAEYTIHTIICTFMMIMGIFFEVYVIIMFLQIYTNKNASEYSYQEIINQIQAYTRQKQMPVDMKKRLEAYYFYRFGNSYFREKKILSNLSNILREEIALHSCHHLIENAILFRNTPKNIITSIVSQLRCEIYLSNDVIIKADSYGDCMFFLGRGTVAVFTPTGHEICHLEVGSYFGEVALLVQDQRRVATVIATEVCEVYRLDRRDFRRYVAVHSELFEEIERTATVRIEKAILVEEYYKRHPEKKFKSSNIQLDS